MDLYYIIMCIFAKYKNMFGKPLEGLHSYRLFNIAIVDLLLTILLSFLISFYFKTNIYKTMISLFLLSIILHRFFCVRTTIDKLLF
jgi:hypothetical protein